MLAAVSIGVSEFPDYQLGFRSCLANVNQYLLLTDQMNGSEGWMMSQLSNKLCRSRRRGEASSTMDSDPGQREAAEEEPQNLRLPCGNEHEEGKSVRSVTPKLQTPLGASSLPGEDAYKLLDAKQIVVFEKKVPSRNVEAQSIGYKKPECVITGLVAGNTELNVWRPWWNWWGTHSLSVNICTIDFHLMLLRWFMYYFINKIVKIVGLLRRLWNRGIHFNIGLIREKNGGTLTKHRFFD